jgi:predicted DNA-binding antitoxin AbrB/MazE fold protein
MNDDDAVFRHGAFQPLGPVTVREDERVRLHIKTADSRDYASEAMDWLRAVEALQASVRQRRGDLPDSSIDIAADRAR